MNKKEESFVNKVVSKLKKHKPLIAVFQGSGFENIITLENPSVYTYKSLGFKYHEIKGHERQFVFGTYKGVEVVVASRFHYYEFGNCDLLYNLFNILAKLGVKTVIATTAVGGINTKFDKGDIMLLKSHINYAGYNPLIGRTPIEFVDLTNAYDKKLRDIAKASAKKLEIELFEGVHLQACGPTYETPAEVVAYRKMGADTVSMSTAFDNICARKFNMKFVCFAGISNKAVTIDSEELSHEEVVEACRNMSVKVKKIIEHSFAKIVKNS
ncbi:MAG: purine-nucleoside phosphorylase [Clostridia bacterium]|nr:purine-nucleoside phosphorylase [Clostridia bacterium]